MEICKNDHAEIVHGGNYCPICIQLEEKDKVIKYKDEELDELEKGDDLQQEIVNRLRKELSEALGENAELKQTLENAVNQN